MNKTTKEIRNGKLIRITKYAWEILKKEKRKQGKSMARILSDLIIESYEKNN